MVSSALSALLEDVGDAVWSADVLARAAVAEGVACPSGHAPLDAQLPGGGWPVGAMCEILQPQAGQYEWRLLLPALRGLPQQVVLVGAPWVPFGPGLAAQGLQLAQLVWVRSDTLADQLWAAEQVLRCAGVDALLLWLPRVRADHLRRLHMAAQKHSKLLFVMRPLLAQHESSPAVLRLQLGGPGDPGMGAGSNSDHLSVHILKRRGPPLGHPIWLAARAAPLSVQLSLAQSQPPVSARPQLVATQRADHSPVTLLPTHVLDRIAATA
jgi:protein ImuA